MNEINKEQLFAAASSYEEGGPICPVTFTENKGAISNKLLYDYPLTYSMYSNSTIMENEKDIAKLWNIDNGASISEINRISSKITSIQMAHFILEATYTNLIGMLYAEEDLNIYKFDQITKDINRVLHDGDNVIIIAGIISEFLNSRASIGDMNSADMLATMYIGQISNYLVDKISFSIDSTIDKYFCSVRYAEVANPDEGPMHEAASYILYVAKNIEPIKELVCSKTDSAYPDIIILASSFLKYCYRKALNKFASTYLPAAMMQLMRAVVCGDWYTFYPSDNAIEDAQKMSK
jgi:hypothetical protein